MGALTADDTTLLRDVSLFIEPVEVYDTAGKLLGLFVPANLERGKRLYDEAVARIDWAEIERRRTSDEEAYPLEEVRHRLQALEGERERRRTAGERALTEEEALEFIDRLRKKG
jgi:hypothetical protein